MTREEKFNAIRHSSGSPKDVGETPALLGLVEKGSVLVESAITTMLLFVMLFGIIDFGRALYTYHFVANAARQATRWASVNGSSCNSDPNCPNGGPASEQNIATYVAEMTPPGIDAKAIKVAADWPQGTVGCTGVNPNAPGCPVQVTVSYNFNFLVPLGHKGLMPISSSSEMVISH